MRITDAPVRRAGPSDGAMGVPTGMPEAPRGVGPVALVAHVLPFEVEPGALEVDADVRGHPHIGLVAMSVLLDGHVTHRDSLGNRHEVGPGGIGWTSSGSGVVHAGPPGRRPAADAPERLMGSAALTSAKCG